jgi:hypothetical protein
MKAHISSLGAAWTKKQGYFILENSHSLRDPSPFLQRVN